MDDPFFNDIDLGEEYQVCLCVIIRNCLTLIVNLITMIFLQKKPEREPETVTTSKKGKLSKEVQIMLSCNI